MVSPVIRISPNPENSENDLLRVLYIDKRLRKSNGEYYKRTQCYKKMCEIRSTNEFKRIDSETPPDLGDVDNLARTNLKQINFWNMPNHGQIPELLYQTPQSENFQEINIVAPFLNEPNNYLLVELHLIVDIAEFKKKLRKHQEGNIFECVIRSKLLKQKSWKQLVTIFGSSEVDLSDEHMFIQKLGVGFEICMSFHHHKKKTEYRIIHRSRLDYNQKYISLEYVGKTWDDNKSVIKPSDMFILRPKNYFKSFPCTTPNCNYYAVSEFHLKRHLKNCGTETKIEYKQKN